MGRRKLEMKRIEDQSSRRVTFSKRRVGLIRKARQLSVLCDIQVSIIIFSSSGRLYDFCSAGSLRQIVEMYQKSSSGAEVKIGMVAEKAEDHHSRCTNFRTTGELLQTVERYVKEPNIEQFTVTDVMQLEEELGAALMQTRLRKTQLMMEYIKNLHEKGRMLGEENEQMVKKMTHVENNAIRDGVVAELNNLATNQINSSPQQVTLPLFIK